MVVDDARRSLAIGWRAEQVRRLRSDDLGGRRVRDLHQARTLLPRVRGTEPPREGARDRVKLVNTSAFPDDLVREVYNFVKPHGVSPKEVKVRNGRDWGTYSGHSYHSGRIVVTVSAKDPMRVYSMRRHLHDHGLKATNRLVSPRGYLDFALLSPVESLVAGCAHELRHQWQLRGIRSKEGGVQMETRTRTKITYDAPGSTVETAHAVHYGARRVAVKQLCPKRRRGMVWGARGRFSERECDAYAVRMVRAWRRAHRAEPRLDSAIIDQPFAVLRKIPITFLDSNRNRSAWFIENRLTREIVTMVHSEAKADSIVGA
jgi:hypothetical protein